MSEYPWRELREIALAHLEWQPEVFWAATPRDLCVAVAGKTKGHERVGGKPGLNTDEKNRLYEMLQEARKGHLNHERS